VSRRNGWATRAHVDYDVVVVGYGGAGAVAAIEAADAGARVLLVEKTRHLGGTTLLSSGFARVASSAAGAAAYLTRTSGYRVGASLVDALAQGMTDVPAYLQRLAHPVNAAVRVKFGADQAANEMEDLYDWPGREVLGWAGIEAVPGFDGYPWVQGGTRGQLLIRVLEANVHGRPIDVWLEAPAARLIVEQGSVMGVQVERTDERIQVAARGGVVLASGGFEFDHAMMQRFMELPILYPMGHAGNTGDGIRMAQQAGAALWHMWHVHGSYGFKLPGMPVAVRNPLGGARNPARPLGWILVDQRGRRFTNELPPAPQDTLVRELAHLDAETGTFDRIPAWLIFDDAGRRLGPIGRPVGAQPGHFSAWSRDNTAEVERGWIVAASTVEALAERIQLPADGLLATIQDWNRAVRSGRDEAFGRPPGSLVPIATPPYYAIQAWPVCSNTQGGPVHDEHQRVLDAFDQPIPGLYAVGELGSFFGHIYLLGGNLTEGIVGGRIAGRHAARRAGGVAPASGAAVVESR
jgi:succinate dehydrogenase/fumarate reductase flavoprotein subunit